MSMAGEKEKNPESASSQSVTDVSRFPIEDEDRKGKYELYEMPGGTVYCICLLGDMFESLYALAGFVAVVTGMLWALHYAAPSPSREGSDEDELGTDIDNPEWSPSTKGDQRQTKPSEGPVDSEISTTTENSTTSQPRPESANQAEKAKGRLIESDSESTQSSIDDFADAMDTVEHQDQNPNSDRLNGGSGDGSRDEKMEEKENGEYQDQARELLDQAIDDAFLILDGDGSEVLNGEAKTPEYADHAVEDMNIPEDASASSGCDSNLDIGLDEALEDAYAKLDMEDKVDQSFNHKEDTIDESKSHQAPVSEEVNISVTKPEELIPESPAVPESKDDSQETADKLEAVESDEDITTVQTSVEYIMVESNDVPNAPVVKNAIDDDVVEDGSDDTTTSSDADTVKDAGGDIKARENELDKDEKTQVLNVVAELISDEMVKEIMGDVYHEGEHDSSNQLETANVVAGAIANDMVKDAERDIIAMEHELSSNERTDVVNVVADVIANDMVNDVERGGERAEHNLSKDEETDVVNVVADVIANDMIIDGERDSHTTKPSRDEQTEVLNVVSDRNSNEILDEITQGDSVQNEDCVENANDLVQPVDTQNVECTVRYDENFENSGPDGENYDANRVSVVNVVAESLASEMVQDILDESVIKSGWCEAVDDNELYQTGTDENEEENQLPFDRRVSGVQIPQIRIESVDDDELIDEVNVGDDFASPQWGDENEYTSALPVEDDHNVPNDNNFAKEEYLPNDYIPDSDENQNQTKAETQTSAEMGISVRDEEDDDFQNDLQSDAEDTAVSNVSIVATVETSNGDPFDVRDLLTKLTGEDVQSADVGDDSDVNTDPKQSVVDMMSSIAKDSIDEHSDDGEGAVVADNRQRQEVDEELISSAAARPVECSSIDIFCSNPQEPSDEFRPVEHQDLSTRLGGDEKNLDSLEKCPVMDGDIVRPHTSEDSIVLTAQASVPKTKIISLLSSLVGDDYTEEREESPVDPTVEEFSLGDVKTQPLLDIEDSKKQYYDGEPICEEGVVAASVSIDEQKDLDPFSKFFCTKVEDDEQSPPCGNGDDIKSLDNDGKVELSNHLAEGGQYLDKVRQTAREDDLVATDVRKTVNGHVNLKSLLKSLGGELSVDVDLNDSDVSEASPQRKKVITDEMVREAIQYLLQKPFLYSYGMYDSNDSLFYNAILDDSTGSRSFALVSSLFGKELTPEKKSTIFALISSKENLNDDDEEEEIDEPIFPDTQDEEESQINFEELFASLDRRPDELDNRAINPPEQEVEEDLIADASGGMEESVPVSSGRVIDDYPEVEDAFPERLMPDSISPSDDDSSSVSSSDTSGTYILDNQMGLVEEDEEDDHERPGFKEPSYPSEMSRYPTNQSHELPGYHGYYSSQTGVEEELEEEPEEEEEPEKPQASRMFFITSAMLAQMNEEQTNESSSDNEYERRDRQSDSPESSSSEDHFLEMPAGYGPNSGRNWPENPVKKHQYLPEDDPTRSYPSEVPTAEYDYDDETRFRPISGGGLSSEPTPRYPTSHVPKDNHEIQHPSQNGHHVFSDYDSSSELLEIEKQRQILFPLSLPQNDNPPQKNEDFQSDDEDMDYLPPKLLPAAEPIVTKNLNYPDETAPKRIADLFENGKHAPMEFKPITEPTITRDMNVPEQLLPSLNRPVFNQDLQESDPHTESHESPESYATRDPGHLEPNAVSGGYAKTNGHTEPLSQSEDSMWSHSDYRGYSGSSEDGEFDYDDDTSFASGERMFALIGLPSNSPPAALSVTASIEVYRAEEHMETQKSLYSYEISKGVAGLDGKMVKLQEQSFSFERHSEIAVQSTNNSYEMVVSDSISDSAGEQFSHLRQADNHLEEPHEETFDSDRRSENAQDSAYSPAEGFSMNETVTADFAGDLFAQLGIATDHPQDELKLDLPFDSSGEELTEREGLQRQVESLSELLSERTLDMQRFKDDYPFLDRIMTDPNSTVPGYEEGQLIGLLETYRQLEENVLELMNIYKETKAQLTELELMERV